jgi:hypothetical protein
MHPLTMTDVELETARRAIRQSLRELGIGLALAGAPALILGLYVYLQAFSAKGLIVAFLAPLAALKLLLGGSYRFVTTTIRYGLWGRLALFLFAAVTLGTVGYCVTDSVRSAAAREARIRENFRDSKPLAERIRNVTWKSAEGPAYVRGKVALLVDEDVDYNGASGPLDEFLTDDAPVDREFDVASASWSDAVLSLPAELQATSPDEVTTVVLIKGIRKVTGTYRSKSSISDFPDYAYQYTAYIRVVDLTESTVSATHEIVGPPPPATIESTATTGELPAEAVCEYLACLPRR